MGSGTTRRSWASTGDRDRSIRPCRIKTQLYQVEARAIVRDDVVPTDAGTYVFPGCLLPWLLKHAGECIRRHRRNADGRMLHEREREMRKGWPVRVRGLPFGEYVFYLPPGAVKEPRLEPRWRPGAWQPQRRALSLRCRRAAHGAAVGAERTRPRARAAAHGTTHRAPAPLRECMFQARKRTTSRRRQPANF